MANKTNKPVISTVVLNWNRADLLKNTLDSYLNTISVPFELFIIDNASTDGSRQLIDEYVKQYPEISAVFLPENMGGEAINIGLSMCRGELFHISENDLEYLPGWDQYVLQAFKSFPNLGQLSLFAPVPTDEEVWISKPSILKHRNGVILYEALENVGTSSVIRPEVYEKGIRFENIVGEGNVLFPKDGKFSHDIKQAGFMVAWAHHYLVKNIGHFGEEIKKRLDYYHKTYNAKDWMKIEKLRERYDHWQKQIKPERTSWLFTDVPVLPEKSEPSRECENPRLWSMFDGWTAEVETVEFIYSLVRLVKPRYVIETGTWHGFTATAIGLALKKNGFGHLDSLEIDPSSVEVARNRVNAYDVNDFVTIHQQSSLAFTPKNKIDFLLLDSALEIREQEFKHFLPFLTDKAVVIFHDTSSRHKVVREQIQKHLKNGVLKGFLIDTPRGIAVFQYQAVSESGREGEVKNAGNKIPVSSQFTRSEQSLQPVCIAGMHRSGTSLLTHMLHESGLYLGQPGDLMPPAPDNPEGFWENLKFVELNDALLNAVGGSWDNPREVTIAQVQQLPHWEEINQKAIELINELNTRHPWGWKDPRNSLTLSFWKHYLPEMQLLIPFRNPLDVAKSLQKRNGFPIEKGLYLWQYYNELLLKHGDNALFVPYELLLDKTEPTFKAIINWLGWQVAETQLGQALKLVKPGLTHFASGIEVLKQAEIPGEIRDLYFHLLELSPFKEFASNLEVKLNVPSAGNTNLPVEQRLQQVQKNIQEGRQEDALKLLSELSRDLTSESPYWNEVGVLYYQLGKLSEALEAFRKAYQLDPYNVNAAKNLADLLFQLGELESTTRIYAQIFAQHPGEVDAAIFAGKVAYLTGQTDVAKQIFQYVSREHPENAVVVENLNYLADHPTPPDGVQERSAVMDEFIQTVLDYYQNANPIVEAQATEGDSEATQTGCPACGSLATRRARYVADIVTCVDCGLTYLRTLPDATRLKTVYDMYADEFSHMRLPESTEEAKQSNLRRDYFLDEIEQYVRRKGQMLDVGCGWGAFLDAARERGFQPRGIEITPRAAEFARKQLDIPVDTRPLEEQQFEKNTFALVTMNHVLEHLPRTREVLDTVYRILEPEGIFAGMVPNFASFCSEMEGEHWSWLDPNFHYVHFTPETLRKHLEAAGFIVEQIYTAKGDYPLERLESCLIQKFGELSAEQIQEKIKELEAAGKGEEIRFIARKPAQERQTVQQNNNATSSSEAVPVAVDEATTSSVTAKVRSKGGQKRKQFSIIIPVYNQVDYTRVCLEKIYANTDPDINFEVIVVDNASTDETPSFMKEATERYPDLHYIRSEQNLKYAGGCNLGAQKAKGKYLVFLNNDTEPQPGWLRNAWKAFQEEKNVGILGAKLLYPDRTIQHCGIEFQNSKINDRFIWPFHRYRFAREDNPLVNRREDVHAVTGACLFIPRNLFQKTGGFDEAYGMYFEDTDLCFTVKAMGKRVVYEPSVVVIHHEGKSTAHLDTIHELNEIAAERFYQKWEDELVTIALDVLTDRVDGKYHYFSEFFYPRRIEEHNLSFLAKLLQRLGNFYAYIGGIGDALLFLSTFYDKVDRATVVCAPNSTAAARTLFNQLEKIDKVYFLPFPGDGLWHFTLRNLWYKVPACKGVGVTPRAQYDEEWTPGLDIVKKYGVALRPKWPRLFQGKKRTNFQVVLQPQGSVRGMVGTKRNIIRPREWLKLQAFLLDNGFTPIVIGTPNEQEYYPILDGAINARSFNLPEQMRLVASADVFIGADSWGKTLAGLLNIPTVVFKPPRGKDLDGWVDPSEHVFIRPWPSITMVDDFTAFVQVFQQIVGRPLQPLNDTKERRFLAGQQPSPYFETVAGSNNVFVYRQSGMGDVVMAFPFVRAIKEKYPGVKVFFATSYHYKHLVDACPDIDGYLPPEIFMTYLVFEPNAVILNAAKYGYAAKHQIQAYLDEFELHLPEEARNIRLTVPDYARQRVQELLADIQARYKRSGVQHWQKMVLLHPAKGDPNRTWPKERWEELARLLVASGNLVITVGSGSTSENRGVFVLEAEGVAHLEDQLSPIEFVALCEQADVLVSTDSGPVQLAGATDIAIVGIYSVVRGAHRLPYRHGQLAWNAVAIEPECPLAGCYEKMNDETFMKPYMEKIHNGELAPAVMFSNWCLHHDKFACMHHLITVDKVWEALQPFLFDSMDADAILDKVERLIKASDFVAAQKELEKWIRRDDVDARILKRYVEFLKERGEWVQYVEWLEKYVQRNPNDAVAVNELGVVRWQQNRKQEALQLFQSAVNLNGNHPDHVKNLADALLTEEQFDAAIQLYIYLIQKYPQDP